MGEVHFRQVVHQVYGEFAVAQAFVALGLFPGAEVNFVNGVRLVDGIMVLTGFHPFFIVPLVVSIPDNAGGLWWCFPEAGERVSLLQPAAVGAVDGVFVYRSVAQAGDETFPDTAGVPPGVQLVLSPVPAVEVSDHRNVLSTRCPNREVSAGYTVHFNHVATQLIVRTEVLSGLP